MSIAEIENEEITWQPNKGPQERFIRCNAREVLYGGAAGGGKSDGLLMFPSRWFSHPKFRGIIFRRSFPELSDLIERSLELYPALEGNFIRSRKRWYFPNGGRMEFAYLEKYKDRLRYAGRAFTYIAFDELTQYADATAFLFLMSRLRTTANADIPLFIRATANPGGPGHAWVRERYKIPDDGKATAFKDEKTKFRREFMPARVSDNPHLAGSDYERTLEGLAENDRKALFEGRWDVYEGQAFTEWNPRKHICEPFPIPSTWKRWRGGDDGYQKPASIHWFAQSSDGDIYVYNEIYQSKLLARDLGLLIRKRDGEHDIDGVLDSAAFADTGTSEIDAKKSRGQQMNAVGCQWKPAAKGPGSRIQSKALVHDALSLRPDGSPRVRIFRNCVNLIRTLPALPYDPNKPEDVDTNAEDHAYDSFRYGLQRVEGLLRIRRVKSI